MECLSCKSLSGVQPISPGPVIFESNYWQVEHVYPTGVLGWLVIVLKRHTEALHDLSGTESQELGQIQLRLSSLLHQELGSQKEYCWCFAEAEGFEHIHFHMLAKPIDLDPAHRGVHVWNFLKQSTLTPLTESEVVNFCKALKQKMNP